MRFVTGTLSTRREPHLTIKTDLPIFRFAARVSWIARRFVHGAAIVILVAQLFSAGAAEAMSRIKDIADFEGVRDNQLIRYGLVVGINGTGDCLTNLSFA